MPRSAGGVATMPANSTGTTGQAINSAKYNAVLADLESMLTDSWSRSGKGAATANLDMGGFKITGGGAPSDPNDYIRLSDLGGGALVPSSREIEAGAGLTGGGTLASNMTMAVGAGTAIVVNANDVAVDKASAANMYACASNKVVTADMIEAASAGVAMTDAATVAFDWDAGVFRTLTITASRILGNPTNGQPGTFRTVLVQASTSTDRALTFGNQYLGEVPTISDIDDGRWYILTVLCVTTTHFVVSAKRAKGS